MKRIICIVLSVLSLLTVCVGCGGDGAGATKPAAKTDVVKPLTMAEIDAIPVVSPDMTVDQLREIVCTFMRYQNSIAWTPSKEFDYFRNYDKTILASWPAGSVIGGMPYIQMGSGSLYNFMHFYVERNGMLDIEAIEALKQPMSEVIANQCSGSTIWAWNRVSNSLKGDYSYDMVEANNYLPLPLGFNYFDESIASFKFPALVDSAKTCKDYGEQTIYEGYACLQPADGLVHFLGERGGHVMMASCKAVVVKKPDGTIDGSKSYVTILDQTFTKHTSVQSNGIKIDTLGGVDTKKTFKKLFDDGYLPFTIPEFVGLDPVEKPETTSSHTKETMTYDELSVMKVKSNYAISYATITVKDNKGKEIYSENVYTCRQQLLEFKPFDALVLDTAKLRSLANGKNTIEITVRVGTGELLTMFSGAFAAKK